MDNVFVKDVDYYTRDIDLKSAYLDQMAIGLSLQRNISYEAAMDFVKQTTSPIGNLPIQDPPIKYVGRQANGDRIFRTSTFLGYLDTIASNELIVSPALTVYKNKKQQTGITSMFIEENIKGRNLAKREMFTLKEEGNENLSNFKNLEQVNYKYSNNSLSGAHVSKSTVLYMPTVHSTLTSTCRSASGYGNANNEKVLIGNRHYWSPDIVISNILYILSKVDDKHFQTIVDKYNLHIPTATEVMECITYSTNNYFKDKRGLKRIEDLVVSLKPIQRAIFTYTSDLYHLRKHNEPLMRQWLGSMVIRPTEPNLEGLKHIGSLTEEARMLVALICADLMDGKSVFKHDELTLEAQGILGATVLKMIETNEKYKDLMEVILVSDCMPHTLAHVPEMVRRVTVASDTDSTIFTTQEWMEWWSGELNNNPETINVGHMVAYLATSTITHLLANMSANLGVDKKELFSYSMKSEYWFPVFALTGAAKTYFAIMGAQEGIAFTKDEYEVKGRVLKGSNAPKELVEDSGKLMEEILNKTRAGDKLSIVDICTRVADLEREIFSNIKKGNTDFYQKLNIKEEDTYTQGPFRSNYYHYLLWENVFAPKYGNAPLPPYDGVRVKFDINNKTDYLAWLDKVQDEALKERLAKFLAEAGKDKITTMVIPMEYTTVHGLPEEVILGVNSRGMVSTAMEQHYVLLETLGMFYIDKNNERLVSDEY